MARGGLGSLLLIEEAEASWSAGLARRLERFTPAGLLFRRLISPELTAEVCRESARASGALPFLAVEEEGGGALRTLFPALPRALMIDREGAGDTAELIGRAFVALGLNLDLAPALDLEAGTVALNPARLGRTAAPPPWPEELAERAEAFVTALSASGVLCCGRHFPGLPSRTPAGGAPVVNRSLAALWREDLLPYRRLDGRLAAIQVGHAVHRAYDYEFPRPAAFSTGVIEGLLRAKLGYAGVALADATVAAAAAHIDLDEAVVRALAAGCDLVTVPADAKVVEGVCRSLAGALDSGRVTVARASEAMARVQAARRRIRRPAIKATPAEFRRLGRDFEALAQRQTPEASA